MNIHKLSINNGGKNKNNQQQKINDNRLCSILFGEVNENFCVNRKKQSFEWQIFQLLILK